MLDWQEDFAGSGSGSGKAASADDVQAEESVSEFEVDFELFDSGSETAEFGLIGFLELGERQAASMVMLETLELAERLSVEAVGFE